MQVPAEISEAHNSVMHTTTFSEMLELPEGGYPVSYTHLVEVALCVGGVKFLVGCIDSLMILFIDLVFLFEGNVSDCTRCV